MKQFDFYFIFELTPDDLFVKRGDKNLDKKEKLYILQYIYQKQVYYYRMKIILIF